MLIDKIKDGVFSKEEKSKVSVSVDAINKALELLEPFLTDVGWGAKTVTTPSGEQVVSRQASTASKNELIRFLERHKDFRDEKGRLLISHRNLRTILNEGEVES